MLFCLQGFPGTLLIENLHTGINVICVCPGFTTSSMRNTALSEQKKHCRTKTITQEILKTIVKRERILVLTGQGKLAVRPGITDGLVYNPFKKEPESPLK